MESRLWGEIKQRIRESEMAKERQEIIIQKKAVKLKIVRGNVIQTFGNKKYIRKIQTPQEKKFTKIREARSLPKETACKVCYNRSLIETMIYVEGGGTQGHLGFWMCKKHI